MNKALLFGLFAVSLSAQAEWDFRGTPNGWANTALEHISGSEYQTCQTFGSDNPRFKIDRYGNWSEAYPGADYTVSAGSYQITFYSDSKNIQADPVSSCSSNQAPVAVISPAGAQTVDAGTSITFTAAGSSDADGSVAAYNWSTGAASESITVTFSQSQTISLQVTDDLGAVSASASVDITVAGEQPSLWCLRGTPNNWEQTALQFNSETGLYELTQAFSGEEIPARFKIAACTADGTWAENYPAQDFTVVDNSNYAVSFNASSHEILAAEVALPVKPELTVNPGSSDFNSDSYQVTLSYKGENISDSRYLLGSGDVTQGTVFSNGDIISVGADLQAGQSVDLQVFALNAQGSVTQTYTYTKTEAQKVGFTVWLKAPSNWVPAMHHWGALPAGSEDNTTWPGSDEMQDLGDGIYSRTFAASTFSNMIFSNNGAQQTADLTRDKDGCYIIETQSWVETCIEPKDADVSIDPSSATFFTDELSVTLHAAGDDISGGRYTIDGSDPVNGISFTDGTAIVVGGALAVDQSMQVCLWAANSSSRANECFTLTKVTPPEASDFTWDNASVYFVITDRFKDGNPSNNNSYGRPSIDATGKNIGTFHGGDIAGLTEKLNAGYFTDLGVNAIWLTAPYEQAHGFVGGGSNGDFAHYAYHGYYVQDYTNLDANMGTRAEFKQFVDTAHSQGIRVVMDVVMNHAGYNTLKDMHEFNYGSTTAGEYWTPGDGNWFGYHSTINYDGDQSKWLSWWGKDWVRVGLPGYDACGGDDLSKCLAYLPDFKTESTQAVGIPAFLANKATFGQGYLSDYQVAGSKRVRDWITEWLVQYVKDYGIDGFRVDTAKHVTYDNWANLNAQAKAALNEWRQNNPDLPGADWNDEFWSTAEVWGHGVGQSDIHTTAQFDSVINFSFKGAVDGMTANADTMLNQFASYAGQVNSSTDWNVLSYISSHDTGSVFYNGDDARQKRAGTALLLLPGGVQIFYGDELGRVNGDGGSDADQGSRSSIDWSRDNNAVHQHWQKVGQFRRDNPAVGAGQHRTLSGQSSGRAFARSWTNPVSGSVNNVVVVLDGAGQVSINVDGYFADGSSVRNAYDGTVATVTNGSVSFDAGSEGLILLEAI
ncbi:alpha-amylase family glycosyl hydrolase [Psychromonas aquimarina]|uniref:alpha-amylase family glycosyl hydrolase n=1 Tax=Psychromonas aquimarina TaxID=444919 RepID=UPI000404E813|nr:alpha-amylase family glycosyl hydrolase [Psychromonas aquimarina]